MKCETASTQTASVSSTLPLTSKSADTTSGKSSNTNLSPSLTTTTSLEKKDYEKKKYIPQKIGPSLLEKRIIQIIESSKTNQHFTLCYLKPIKPILLSDKDHILIYESLFNLHTSSSPASTKWSNFVHFFEKGLGGKVTPSMGNGSAHILEIIVLNEKGEELPSSRPIHKPHPDGILYDELIKRIKRLFEYWGLAPKQGNIKFK